MNDHNVNEPASEAELTVYWTGILDVLYPSSGVRPAHPHFPVFTDRFDTPLGVVAPVLSINN